MALHRDEDHQTFRKLCYATDHYIKDSIELDQNQEAEWSLSLIYPILVVQGELYDVRPLKRSARVVRTQHVQYCCAQNVNDEEIAYQIDVVTESYVPTFLSTLFREMRLMHRRLVNNHDALVAMRRLRANNHRIYVQRTAARHRDA